MTEEKVIEQVYGSDWDSFSEGQKDVISKMLQWMHRNFGITGEEVTRDRRIIAAVQLAVLDTFGIAYDEIMSKSRKRELVDKRAMIYKIVRELSNSSDRTITKLFPRNRVTVAYHGFRVSPVGNTVAFNCSCSPTFSVNSLFEIFTPVAGRW